MSTLRPLRAPSLRSAKPAVCILLLPYNNGPSQLCVAVAQSCSVYDMNSTIIKYRHYRSSFKEWGFVEVNHGYRNYIIV